MLPVLPCRVLAWLAGEAVKAFGALKDLQCLLAVSSLALSDGAFAVALRADWVFLFFGD
jgi:hypothetical protein